MTTLNYRFFQISLLTSNRFLFLSLQTENKAYLKLPSKSMGGLNETPGGSH